jgi:predicted nucleic acid-binding protein
LIVVDASVLIDVLVGEGRGVGRIADEDLNAPHLLDAEVANVLRRRTLSGALDAAFAARALDDLNELQIARYGHLELLERCWELRSNLSVYDALYVALAEALDAPLVTLDQGIAAVPGIRTTVEVVA